MEKDVEQGVDDTFSAVDVAKFLKLFIVKRK
jgi:hypothetical protein